MKIVGFIVSFLLISFGSFAQYRNSWSVSYGFAHNIYARNVNLYGAVSHEGKGAELIGLKHSRFISKVFSVETGLEYSINKIEMRPAPGIDYPIRNVSVKMFSVPVNGTVLFLRYFYLTAGPVFDFELGRKSSDLPDDQSGIGYDLKMGGRYNVGNFSIFINPFWRNHAVIPLSKALHQEHLTETGIEMGLGFSF